MTSWLIMSGVKFFHKSIFKYLLALFYFGGHFVLLAAILKLWIYPYILFFCLKSIKTYICIYYLVSGKVYSKKIRFSWFWRPFYKMADKKNCPMVTKCHHADFVSRGSKQHKSTIKKTIDNKSRSTPKSGFGCRSN